MMGVLGCAYFFVFNRANARRAALDADTQTKQQALVNLKLATAGVADVNKKIGDLEAAIKFFDDKLPPQREVDNILQEVTQISQSAGLTTQTVKPDKSEKAANYSEEPIELTVNGSFEGIYRFLVGLEQLPRLTRVTQLQLVKNAVKKDKDDTTNQGAITAHMTLSIYFAPDADATASAQ
jgi:type IV pilus assembly protein PilO